MKLFPNTLQLLANQSLICILAVALQQRSGSCPRLFGKTLSCERQSRLATQLPAFPLARNYGLCGRAAGILALDYIRVVN